MTKLDHTIYRRTAAGERALRSADTAVPVDYRRIVCIIDADTHANVVRGRLRRYADALIEDWLDELVELGFIEAVDEPGGADPDLETLVTGNLTFSALSAFPDERRRVDDETRVADADLTGKGVYLAAERLRNRAPLPKRPDQCVVLIVEDDFDQAALADLRISMAGYGVRLARSRRELIKDLVTKPPADIVLLDVMLPDGNGFEILAGMRRHPKFSLLPVIMLTAKASDEDIRRGLDLGADGYVTKPYSKSLLVDAIGKVLRSP